MKIHYHFVVWIILSSALRGGEVINPIIFARRAVVFHFLASQQKVKRKIYSAYFAPLR